MVTKDYYIILGISRTESSSGIHEAFRKLAKKYHPDRSGPEATETFQEIAQAYEVLSDPERRRTYDRTLVPRERPRWSEPLVQSRPEGRYPAEPLVPTPMSILHDFQTVRPSLDALVDRFLRNFTGLRVAKGERIEDLNIELILTPMEAATGVIAPIEVPVFRTCRSCRGMGRDWLFPCAACAGGGMIEDHEIVSVRIPPMVRDRSILELPIAGLGIHNLYLRLHIRISG